MPIFKLRNKATSALSIADDQSIINFLNPNGTSDYVDASTALHNSDVYSLIFQLSSDLANGRFVAEKSRTQGMLDNPTVTSNAHAFWQSMFAQLLLGGECFAYRWRNQNGIDSNWEYLRPSQVSPYLLEDGSGLIYTVTFDEPSAGVKEAVPQSDMIHIRLLSKNGGKTGISPLSALANELNISKASNRLTLSALAQSISAPGVLKIQKGGLLNAKEKAQRSQRFMQQMQASGSGPIVLDDLEDYQPLEIQGNVAQLLNQANWTGAQIAKVYGVSDSVINGQGDQQSSLAMMGNDYAKSLSRFAKAIDSELSNKLTGNVRLDLRQAIDPLGDTFAGTISSMVKSGTLAGNQAAYVLKQAGYLPGELPKAEEPEKGGENDDQD